MARIHLTLRIEEKAIILRREVCLRGDTAPTKADRIEKTISNLLEAVNLIRTNGPTFCHVLRIRALIHESPAITLGNQKCKGAAPNLINKANLIISTITPVKVFDSIRCIVKAEKIITDDPTL